MCWTWGSLLCQVFDAFALRKPVTSKTVSLRLSDIVSPSKTFWWRLSSPTHTSFSPALRLVHTQRAMGSRTPRTMLSEHPLCECSFQACCKSEQAPNRRFIPPSLSHIRHASYTYLHSPYNAHGERFVYHSSQMAIVATRPQRKIVGKRPGRAPTSWNNCDMHWIAVSVVSKCEGSFLCLDVLLARI